MKKRIGAVILAAGLASRMGRQKLLLPLGGKPLLTHVLDTASSLSWEDCIAVIGDPQAELASLCDQYQIRSVYNPQRQTGQASSIQLALQHLSRDLDGILFILGDQPLLATPLLRALADCFEGLSNKHIVVPQHQGQFYSPALFGADWRDELAALHGDSGGRVLLRKNPAWVTPVNWPDQQLFYDADTWEEYQFLCKEWDERC